MTGYDYVEPFTDITILVAGIKTLPVLKTNVVKVGIKIIYKHLANLEAYLYLPTSFPLPAAGTAYSNPTPITSATVSATGSTLVLGNANYEFTFTIGTSVTTADYILFEFEPNYFNKYFDFTNVAGNCGGSPCQKVVVLGYSNMVYVKHSSPLSGSLTLTINNLINPAYA